MGLLAFTLGLLFFIVITILLFCMLPFFIIIFSINFLADFPYFFLGKHAGFNHSWIAFLPTGRDYIAFTIPHKKYDNGIIQTRKRKIVFWIYFAYKLIRIPLYNLIRNIQVYPFFLFSVYMSPQSHNISTLIDNGTIDDRVILLFYIQLFLVFLLDFLIRSFFNWRKYYDLLVTYDFKQHAVWASILGCFFPPLMFVFTCIMMDRSPDYGCDGYYFTKDSYNQTYEEKDIYTLLKNQSDTYSPPEQKIPKDYYDNEKYDAFDEFNIF